MEDAKPDQANAARLRARAMRNNMGVSERWFWEAVRKDRLGFRFRRQHSFGPYFLDFYCPAAKLCVEIDGEFHAERREADLRRDQYLAENGILTLRIPSLDLFEKDEDRYSRWVGETERLCRERTGS